MTGSPITSWSEAFAALRKPGSRGYAALTLGVAAELYVACFFVSEAVAVLGYSFAARPALVAVVGHEPMPTVEQGVAAAAGGVLALLAWIKAVQPALWRWSASIWELPPSGPGEWSADALDVLDLYVMTDGPRSLAGVVWVLSPYRPAPSWWHPWRRMRVKAGWGRRNAEIGAEAGALADAGLLRCTENARWGWERKFEITDAGRAASEAAAVGVTEGAS